MQEHGGGSIVNGFQATIALWIWAMVVLLHATWRSFFSSTDDPVRPSGPIR